ncbi:MAG: protein kinase [Roseburia sp.]
MSREAKDMFNEYYREQLKQISLPERVTAEYELFSCLYVEETDAHASFLLRRKRDGKRFLLKRRRGEAMGSLKREAEQLRRLAAVFPEEYRVPEYWEENGEYLLREYYEGSNLEEYVWRNPGRTKAEVLALAAKICEVVGAFHRLEPPIIHRDIKPQNLILDMKGRIHCIDFETARNYGGNKKKDTAFFGTEVTAAPEQYGYAQTDVRTDVYGIGKVLDFLLTGDYEEHFRGKNAAEKKIERVILTSCSFDPAKRYRDTESMRQQLVKLQKKEERDTGRNAVLALGAAEIIIAMAELVAIAGIYCAMAGAGLTSGKAVSDSPAVVGTEEPGATKEPEKTGEPDEPEISGEPEVSGEPEASEETAFKDAPALLQEAVKVSLGKETVTQEDLAEVTRLVVIGDQVYGWETSEEDLESSVTQTNSLEAFNLGEISDISLLAQMPNLMEVYLCNQKISSIDALAGLPIRRLYLCGNQIADFEVLETLPELEILYIMENPAITLPDMRKLESLKQLNIAGCQLSSLDFLDGAGMDTLMMQDIHVVDGDYSVLTGLPNLTTLCTGQPEDGFIEVLPELTGLRSLTLWSYPENNLEAIKTLVNLRILTVSGDALTTMNGVENLENLREFCISYSGISDISPIRELLSLQLLIIRKQMIEDYTPLMDCQRLRQVHVDPSQKEAIEKTDPEHRYELVE